MSEKTIFVEGMHCPACVQLITTLLEEMPEIDRADVKPDGKVTIAYENEEPELSAMSRKLAPHGYKVHEKRPQHAETPASFKPGEWALPVLLATGFSLIYILIQHSGVGNIIGFQEYASQPIVAVLVGLAASLSTCLAITGGIVISFMELYQTAPENKNASVALILPNTVFHLGRLGGFFLLGGLLGLIGGGLTLNGKLAGIVQLSLAVLLLLMGLTITGILPKLGARMGIKAPRIFGSLLNGLKTSRNPLAPLAVGALTFFLPCGFTQSMQVLALSSGSFLAGGLVMLAFAAGTVPVLFLIGITARWSAKSGKVSLQRAAGLVVILLALLTFQSGLGLLDFDRNLFAAIPSGDNRIAPDPMLSQQKTSGQAADTGPQTPQAGQPDPAPSQADSQPGVAWQEVEMHVTYRGFEPSQLKIKAGVPVRWIIWGDQVSGCTNAIIIPKLDISSPVNPGRNVVEFNPGQAGTINFSCWMGMVRGVFVVE